ncbi:MAG: tetratricopeptide repeat protein [Planctomycetes bacterium]|nr:tetratricopeptide repeat protein [Planctomycetota bacterium]
MKTVLRRNFLQALGKRDLDGAKAILERLKTEEPLALETRGLELEYLIRSDSLAEAKGLAGQLLELHPGSARVQYLAGLLAYRQKDYAAAERHLRESHRLFPHSKNYRLLGKTLTQQRKFEEAEGILQSLAPGNPWCQLDLAWLYERKEDWARALSCIEAFLKVEPDDKFAKSQLLRLKARLLEPEELLEEVSSLTGLGEEVPEDLLPQYVEALLKRGESTAVRDFIQKRQAGWSARAARSVGWICYRLQAYDLAMDLFLKIFRENRGDAKFLSALEAAAKRCGRLAELLPVYGAQVQDDKRFYSRIRSVKSRLEERKN